VAGYATAIKCWELKRIPAVLLGKPKENEEEG
jgi:hypothetical protein